MGLLLPIVRPPELVQSKLTGVVPVTVANNAPELLSTQAGAVGVKAIVTFAPVPCKTLPHS